MKTKWWFYVILLAIVIIGISIFFIYKFFRPKITNNYSVNKISTETNKINNVNNDNEIAKNYNNTDNTNTNELSKNNTNDSNNVNSDLSVSNQNTLNKTPKNNLDSKNFAYKNSVEELISTFSTKIYTKDSERQNNIALTCNTLNNTIVKNGSTFSFCDTLGPSTTSQGYKKADVFDKNGNIQKGLGGGKCQVSSTLYNAVLKVPNLVVTERHKHSNKVPYVSEGKDAAVAYRKL